MLFRSSTLERENKLRKNSEKKEKLKTGLTGKRNANNVRR